mmetsp:Transcript_49611/g.92985  ORF Transcript_49611/g.92985 Transcript_49611/m.92985 type:complete len:172 (+) Transcript_49611:3097-3612(+)
MLCRHLTAMTLPKLGIMLRRHPQPARASKKKPLQSFRIVLHLRVVVRRRRLQPILSSQKAASQASRRHQQTTSRRSPSPKKVRKAMALSLVLVRFPPRATCLQPAARTTIKDHCERRERSQEQPDDTVSGNEADKAKGGEKGSGAGAGAGGDAGAGGSSGSSVSGDSNDSK